MINLHSQVAPERNVSRDFFYLSRCHVFKCHMIYVASHPSYYQYVDIVVSGIVIVLYVFAIREAVR